jgi:hypothetical protein
MKRLPAEKPIRRKKEKRVPKAGASFRALRILGGILKWTGIVAVGSAVLVSCCGVFRAALSFLPYREQRMAGLITILQFTHIAVFFICLVLLGGCLAVAGILIRRAGTRKAPNEGDPGFPAAGGQTPGRPQA